MTSLSWFSLHSLYFLSWRNHLKPPCILLENKACATSLDTPYLQVWRQNASSFIEQLKAGRASSSLTKLKALQDYQKLFKWNPSMSDENRKRHSFQISQAQVFGAEKAIGFVRTTWWKSRGNWRNIRKTIKADWEWWERYLLLAFEPVRCYLIFWSFHSFYDNENQS